MIIMLRYIRLIVLSDDQIATPLNGWQHFLANGKTYRVSESHQVLGATGNKNRDFS